MNDEVTFGKKIQSFQDLVDSFDINTRDPDELKAFRARARQAVMAPVLTQVLAQMEVEALRRMCDPRLSEDEALRARMMVLVMREFRRKLLGYAQDAVLGEKLKK
jgi:hypothetical protein